MNPARDDSRRPDCVWEDVDTCAYLTTIRHRWNQARLVAHAKMLEIENGTAFLVTADIANAVEVGETIWKSSR